MDAGSLRMSEYYFEGDFSQYAPLFMEGDYRTVAKQYQAGDMISSQGETLSHGYYIQRGVMQLKIGTEVGKERTIAFFGPGSVFPLGINEHHYRMEYAMAEVALGDVEAREFSYTELRRMVDDHPDLGVRMIEHYCDFTSYLFYALATTSYGNATAKVASVLSALDEHMVGGGVIPLSQEDVAEVAGISKVQVARAYRTLVDAGVIATRRRGVQVTDAQRLAEDFLPELP